MHIGLRDPLGQPFRGHAVQRVAGSFEQEPLEVAAPGRRVLRGDRLGTFCVVQVGMGRVTNPPGPYRARGSASLDGRAVTKKTW